MNSTMEKKFNIKPVETVSIEKIKQKLQEMVEENVEKAKNIQVEEFRRTVLNTGEEEESVGFGKFSFEGEKPWHSTSDIHQFEATRPDDTSLKVKMF